MTSQASHPEPVEGPPLLPLPHDAAALPVSATSVSRPRQASRARRLLMLPLQLFWGMVFCQSLAGSILVVGWAYRLAQRTALKRWWSGSERGRSGNEQFDDFVNEMANANANAAAAGAPVTRPAMWPTWFLGPRLRHGGAVRRWVTRWLGGITWNLRTGAAALFNTSVVALPPGLLWWFGWYDGWNNSFAKGYEHAAVGPLISILGIVIFIPVMFYLPLAQARQALTGNWRAFYDFRLVRRLVRQRWLACVGLALAYTALAFPLNVLKTVPMFLPQINPGLGALSDAEALRFLQRFFFWSSLWVFPAYVFLRVMAARIYAAGLLEAVQTGALPAERLEANERLALERLQLLERRPARTPHVLVRFIRWTGTLTGRWVAGTVAALAWFAFVAQIYTAEFFVYHNAQGFVNQPLIQLPWFSYLPGSLAHPARELPLLLGFAVLLAILRCFSFKASPVPPEILGGSLCPPDEVDARRHELAQQNKSEA